MSSSSPHFPTTRKTRKVGRTASATTSVSTSVSSKFPEKDLVIKKVISGRWIPPLMTCLKRGTTDDGEEWGGDHTEYPLCLTHRGTPAWTAANPCTCTRTLCMCSRPSSVTPGRSLNRTNRKRPPLAIQLHKAWADTRAPLQPGSATALWLTTTITTFTAQRTDHTTDNRPSSFPTTGVPTVEWRSLWAQVVHPLRRHPTHRTLTPDNRTCLLFTLLSSLQRYSLDADQLKLFTDLKHMLTMS